MHFTIEKQTAVAAQQPIRGNVGEWVRLMRTQHAAVVLNQLLAGYEPPPHCYPNKMRTMRVMCKRICLKYRMFSTAQRERRYSKHLLPVQSRLPVDVRGYHDKTQTRN